MNLSFDGLTIYKMYLLIKIFENIIKNIWVNKAVSHCIPEIMLKHFALSNFYNLITFLTVTRFDCPSIIRHVGGSHTWFLGVNQRTLVLWARGGRRKNREIIEITFVGTLLSGLLTALLLFSLFLYLNLCVSRFPITILMPFSYLTRCAKKSTSMLNVVSPSPFPSPHLPPVYPTWSSVVHLLGQHIRHYRHHHNHDHRRRRSSHIFVAVVVTFWPKCGWKT